MKRRGRTSGSSPKKLPTKSTRTPRTTQAKRSSSLSSEELQRQIADLTHELKEARDQQAATANVLRIISGSTFDLQSVLDTLVEAAARLCEADHAWLFRRDGQILHWVASFGYGSEAHNRLRDFFKTKVVLVEQGSVTGRAVLEGKAVQVPDVLADPEYTYGDAQKVGGYRAALGVPLLSAGEVVGVIFVSKVVPEPFREKQIALVTTFADQAVIAIENTRLLKELRQRTDDLTESLHQQTATADVLKVISRSTFDLEVVLNTLSESAARLCDGHISWIFRRDGEVLRWAASYGHTPEAHTRIRDYFRPLVVPIDRSSVVGRAASEAAVVHLSDVLTDPEYRWQNAQKIGGYRAALGAPLVREGRVVGALFVAKTTTKPFTEKHIELVKTFADQAVIAIENARLFDSVQAHTRELATSLEDLRAAQDRLIQTEKLASLGQLTAGIAHEIKNPLNFVNNFSAVSVELIDELREALAGAHLDIKLRTEIGDIADMLQGNLDKVVQHGKRADSIVKNMLLHSRQGSGEHRAVDINALVEESLNLAYHGARAEKEGFNITLERSLDPVAGEVDLFPQEITRVLLNLISNGFYAATKRKAQAGDGYESILAAATKNLGDSVEISIRDNGAGIPPEVKEKMFNPFFTTKPAGEGTGLGLSLSYDIIVKQHAGAIEVDTQPGEYTEFKIILPRGAATMAKSGGRP